MNADRHPYGKFFLDLQRPQQYTGGEWNTPRESPTGLPRVTLVYPDTYELGMSNHGLTIIRHILLADGGFDVRRAFCPAPDLHRLIRERGVEWVDLESAESVRSSRVVGIGVPCESLFTNVLSLMELMGIPLRSAERGEDSPIILLGGGGLSNPLPISPFADAFFLGEAEETAVALFRILASGDPREERLSSASRIPGVFVPSVPGGRVVVQKISELREEWVPVRQLVPISRISQDRAVVEIARGCTRGCRFCQASAVTRPVRERPVGEVLGLMDRVLECTGWEKAGLLSLSFSDYSELPELLDGVERTGLRRHVSIGRPSLRPDTMQRLSGSVRMTGRMTLAPEAGSERLRRMMNKPMGDSEILDAVRSAFSLGAKGIKLYFMLGLPGETMEDVEALGRLALEIGAVARSMGRKPARSITIALSPFVPKAHTPLQWSPMTDESELWKRIGRVRDICGRKLSISWNSPRISLVEAVLGLGDDGETADLLEEAVHRGACFDAWADLFRWDIWKALFDEHPSVLTRVYRGSLPGEGLPWSFVDTGVSEEYLRREWQKCMEAETTGDCREVGCVGCGVCEERVVIPRITHPTDDEDISPAGQREPAAVLRVRYSRTGLARFSSHLDSVRMWGRAVRRSGLPVAWSGGYVIRPRLQFGPPLPLGMESTAEYVDILLEAEPPADVNGILQDSLPVGFDLIGTVLLPASAKSPAKGIRAAEYEITPEMGSWPQGGIMEIVVALRENSHVFEAEALENGSLRIVATEGNKDARPDTLIEPFYSGRVLIRRTDIFVEGPNGLKGLAPRGLATGVDSI